MAKLWTGNKTWQGNTTPVAGTKYLVGAANGKCSYQTFNYGDTKRCLVSNGTNGNVAYQNVTMPLPDMTGNADIISLDYLNGFTIPVTERTRANAAKSGSGNSFILSSNSTYKRYDFSPNSEDGQAFLSGAALVIASNVNISNEVVWNNNVKPVIESYKTIEVWMNSHNGWVKKCLINVKSWSQLESGNTYQMRGEYDITVYYDPVPNPIYELRVVVFK